MDGIVERLKLFTGPQSITEIILIICSLVILHNLVCGFYSTGHVTQPCRYKAYYSIL